MSQSKDEDCHTYENISTVFIPKQATSEVAAAKPNTPKKKPATAPKSFRLKKSDVDKLEKIYARNEVVVQEQSAGAVAQKADNEYENFDGLSSKPSQNYSSRNEDIVRKKKPFPSPKPRSTIRLTTETVSSLKVIDENLKVPEENIYEEAMKVVFKSSEATSKGKKEESIYETAAKVELKGIDVDTYHEQEPIYEEAAKVHTISIPKDQRESGIRFDEPAEGIYEEAIAVKEHILSQKAPTNRISNKSCESEKSFKSNAEHKHLKMFSFKKDRTDSSSPESLYEEAAVVKLGEKGKEKNNILSLKNSFRNLLKKPILGNLVSSHSSHPNNESEKQERDMEDDEPLYEEAVPVRFQNLMDLKNTPYEMEEPIYDEAQAVKLPRFDSRTKVESLYQTAIEVNREFDEDVSDEEEPCYFNLLLLKNSVNSSDTVSKFSFVFCLLFKFYHLKPMQLTSHCVINY